jgi:hypothetical protein
MKNSIRILIITLSIVACVTSPVHAQMLSERQTVVLQEKAKEILSIYEEAMQLTTDGEFIDEELVQTLGGLFVSTDNKIVYNDLLPPKVSGSTYLPPNDYVLFARVNYVGGVDVRLEIRDINFGPPEYEKGEISMIVRANKKITGLYRRVRIYRFDEDLFFYMTAQIENETVRDMKITRVYNVSMQAKATGNKRISGLYFGFNGGMGISQIYSSTLASDNNWSVVPGQSVFPTLEAVYMFSRGFGLGTGLRMSTFKSTMNLGYFANQSPLLQTDMDGDTYYPGFSIDNLTEFNVIKSNDIPVLLKFRSGKGKTGLFFDLGVVYSMFSKATYSLDGNATRTGYYPDYNVTLQDIPEYGYNTVTFTSDKLFEQEFPASGLSGYMALGLSIPIIDNLLMNIGGNITYGITDIGFNRIRHEYDFISTTGNEPSNTILQSAGFYLGLSYRILK